MESNSDINSLVNSNNNVFIALNHLISAWIAEYFG